jgi:chemotaxis protein methyltransferase CheR
VPGAPAEIAWNAGHAIRPLTPREFALFQALIHREAGIHLSEAKQALLVGRLSRRLRELGLSSFGAYYAYATDPGNPAEQVELINRICTHETHFFREPRQFEFLERTVAPAWQADAQAGRRAKRVRVWSAGCSSGEEPYSLAMSLLSQCPPDAGWDVEILATDISTKVLERARAATWPIAKAAEVPAGYLKRFMLRGRGEHQGQMKAGPEIRSVVKFQQVNLNAERVAVAGPFDLILCRNVLIYFDAAGRERIARRLLSLLTPDGLLFLGHAESLNGLSDRPRNVIPTVYTRGHA